MISRTDVFMRLTRLTGAATATSRCGTEDVLVRLPNWAIFSPYPGLSLRLDATDAPLLTELFGHSDAACKFHSLRSYKPVRLRTAHYASSSTYQCCGISSFVRLVQLFVGAADFDHDIGRTLTNTPRYVSAGTYSQVRSNRRLLSLFSRPRRSVLLRLFVQERLRG